MYFIVFYCIVLYCIVRGKNNGLYVCSVPLLLGMRSFFDSGGCGAVNYIDVYNMTSALALQLPTEAEKLTYDGVHWGMEVGLHISYIHTYIKYISDLHSLKYTLNI